jgi:hypothetical protein
MYVTKSKVFSMRKKSGREWTKTFCLVEKGGDTEKGNAKMEMDFSGFSQFSCVYVKDYFQVSTPVLQAHHES